MTQKANNAAFIKSISIPSFSKRPITLNGIPNFMSGFAIFSDSCGLFFPRKKPTIKKGIMLIKRE